MTLRFATLTGASVGEVLDDLARLRITVFRDFPYLYEGDLAYERSYLTSYRDNPSACLVAAFDQGTLVGAATAMPMEDHADDFAAPLTAAGYAETAIFYCAESVLLPQYRGQGAGHRFFEEREAAAEAMGRKYSAFCAVNREADHPLRPDDYRPLDGFWRQRGYAPLTGVKAAFEWQDVDQPAPTHKHLQFWMKDLT